MVARLVRDQEVVGSSPVASTKKTVSGVFGYGLLLCLYKIRVRARRGKCIPHLHFMRVYTIVFRAKERTKPTIHSAKNGTAANTPMLADAITMINTYIKEKSPLPAVRRTYPRSAAAGGSPSSRGKRNTTISVFTCTEMKSVQGRTNSREKSKTKNKLLTPKSCLSCSSIPKTPPSGRRRAIRMRRRRCPPNR